MKLAAGWGVSAALSSLLSVTPCAFAEHVSSRAQDGNSYGLPTASSPGVCPSMTINYITHALPQECLRTSWTASTYGAADEAVAASTEGTRASPTSEAMLSGQKVGDKEATEPPSPVADGEGSEDTEELMASAFPSFEEWKEMMLRKSSQDPGDARARKGREEGHTASGHERLDVLAEDGEMASELDALTEKLSDMSSSPSVGSSGGDEKPAATAEDGVLYSDGRTQYYRSPDAGTTSKERFSFASFDAGATVLKTSPGAKNAKALLAENKDTYMLLECATQNKFVIVELSDDVLVDTVVLANFEFFSSMIRRFRVSVADRYPVKMDKWVELGTFEARNSRDVQPFLVEHPQMYTKYVRIEFLSHYGNEYYCPVSLLRVHGTRMLDSWKETDEDMDAPRRDEALEAPAPEPEALPEPSTANDMAEMVVLLIASAATETSPWPAMFLDPRSETCAATEEPTATQPLLVESTAAASPKTAASPQATVASEPPLDGAQPAIPIPVSEPSTVQQQQQVVDKSATASAATQVSSASQDAISSPVSSRTTAVRSTSTSSAASDNPAASSNPSTKSKTTSTSTTSSSTAPSPTIQDNFFKTITKRLSHLESNTTLSLQYIESQSRFLQDAIARLERRQVSRVDAFLAALNASALADLRALRAQHDQLWQSTVLALETQRDAAQREAGALGVRLAVLADEVVFQKRMAILQSVLLLACMVLVIFSRGGGGGGGGGGGSASSSGGVYTGEMGGGYSASPSPTKNGLGARMGSGGVLIGSSPNSPIVRRENPHPSPANSPPSFSRPASFNDKILPLTPTSENNGSSDSVGGSSPPLVAPSIQVELDDGRLLADDDLSSSPSRPLTSSSFAPGEHHRASEDIPTFMAASAAPNSGAGEQPLRTLEGADSLANSSSFAKFEPLHTTSARKPLPALPEDPC